MNLNLGHEMMLFNRFAGGPNMFFVSGDEWKGQDKIISPAFRGSMPMKLFGNLGKDLFKVMEDMDETSKSQSRLTLCQQNEEKIIQ